MVKNKIVRFIVPIITCCLIVVACVVPAKAVTAFPEDPSYRPWVYQAVTSGDVTFIVDDMTTEIEPDIQFNVPLSNVTIDDYNNTNNISFGNFFGSPGADGERLNLIYSTYITDFSFTGFGNTDNKMMFHSINTGIKNFRNGDCYVAGYNIKLNPFSLPVFNQDTMLGLMRLVAIEGCGTFNASLTLKYVGDDGIVHTINYNTENRSIGNVDDNGNATSSASTALDWNDMLKINTLFNSNYNDGRILVESFIVNYGPVHSGLYALNDVLRLRVFAFPLENDSFSGPYPWAYYDAEKFYSSNNIIYTSQTSSGGGGSVIPPSNNAFGDFLVGTIGAVFDTPLFGEFTLGGMLSVIISVLIILWVFKVFAGG